ncbi:MAG: RluA family pseudouridine synthase [Anaeroplasmataceae bacterium]
MQTNYVINKTFNNKTLDEFLKYYHLSLNKINDIEILLNNKECSSKTILKENDILSIITKEEIDFSPMPGNLDIIYEDDYLLIINKPAGILVHPDSKDKTGCIVNLVANYYQSMGKNMQVRYLHRIDTDTTGLLMFAKDILTASYFNYLISIHSIKRTYLAIVCGNMEIKEGIIDEPIGEDRHHNQRRRVSKTGKKAITHYEVIGNLAHNYSLVKLVLETGRTHQIRVHMKYIGHPLAGDLLYGGSIKYINRQALHSYMLDFKHPYTNEDIHLEAPIPLDMKKIIKNKKKD